jgi:hypothetical protein
MKNTVIEIRYQVLLDRANCLDFMLQQGGSGADIHKRANMRASLRGFADLLRDADGSRKDFAAEKLEKLIKKIVTNQYGRKSYAA